MPTVHMQNTHTTTETCDIAIVGCGAAGLMAAIHAAQAGKHKVIALDGAKTLGAKILVAGGGRCNVTHHAVSPSDYFGSPGRSIDRVLKTWPVRDTVQWFADRGVKLKQEDTGKLFPVTDKARTVLDALLQAAQRAGVELRHPCRVQQIQALPTEQQTGFLLHTDHGQLQTKQLILATGGKALPRSGSDGVGYQFAKALGHTVTDTHPALVPLLLPKGFFTTKLSGLAVDAELVVSDAKKKKLYSFAGPVLLTHFGLSGPAPMNVSRHWLTTPHAKLSLNLTQQTFEVCDQQLQQAIQRFAKSTVEQTLFKTLGLPQRLAQALPAHVGLQPGQILAQLKKDQRRDLAHALTDLPLPITGDRGYTHAEVTAGGVPLTEINLATMASKQTPGLHLCGEILNVDGRIGGFNFQWAWCTGKLAGQHAATALANAQA